MRRALPAAVLLLVVSCMSVQAQAPTRSPVYPTESPGRIVFVVKGENGAPLADVAVIARSARDSSAVAQAFSDNAGRVVLSSLPFGDFLVRVSVLGFKGLDLPRIQLTADQYRRNLGDITLEVEAVQLAALEATAQQSPVVFQSDRTIYNTKDVPAAAASVIDVLRTIPELEVSVSGKVTMRGGQDVVIYLNGRPAPVTGEALAAYLRQLPGTMVSKVEVIPNPSAKYDPDGLVGIVNIQLKDLLGGSASVGTNSRFGRSVSGRAGHNKHRLTLLGGASVTSSNSQVDSYDWRENVLANSFIEQRGNIDGDRRQSVFDVTAEFALPTKTVLWGSLFAFWNNSWQTGSAHYDILDNVQALRERYDREHNNEGGYHNVDARVGLKKTEAKQEFSFEVHRTVGSQSATHRLTRQFLMWDGAAVAWPVELTLGDFATDNESLRAQADYWRMLRPRTRLELGYLGFYRAENQDNQLNVVPEAALGASTTSTRGAYHYEETVNALYGVVTHSFGKLSGQLGARAEIASTEFDLPLTQQTFADDYNSIYPNVNLNYSFAQGRSLRVAYSRRITRPVPSYLNPSVAQLDPLNRTAGNPEIRAMYSNLFTVDFTTAYNRGNIRISPYYRGTGDNWEPIKRVDALGVSTVTWENSSSLASYGVEMTATASLGRVSNITGFGLNRDVRDADNLTSVYVRDAVRWNVNSNFGVRLWPSATGQVYLRYFPAYDLVQGRVEGRLLSTLGLFQQVRGGRGTVNVQLVDPFDLLRYKFETHDESHAQTGRSNYKERLLSVSFTYNLGRSPQQQIRRATEDQPTALPAIR
jgi:outer membrane receptor protein involved in Fe transport